MGSVRNRRRDNNFQEEKQQSSLSSSSYGRSSLASGSFVAKALNEQITSFDNQRLFDPDNDDVLMKDPFDDIEFIPIDFASNNTNTNTNGNISNNSRETK